MDFRSGGKLIYAMITPEHEENWAMMEYLTIEHEKSFTALDSFSNKYGEIDESLSGNR
jgi:hypothetical protein